MAKELGLKASSVGRQGQVERHVQVWSLGDCSAG